MMNKRRFTMYTKQPKKMIIINILDILKRIRMKITASAKEKLWIF